MGTFPSLWRFSPFNLNEWMCMEGRHPRMFLHMGISESRREKRQVAAKQAMKTIRIIVEKCNKRNRGRCKKSTASYGQKTLWIEKADRGASRNGSPLENPGKNPFLRHHAVP